LLSQGAEFVITRLAEADDVAFATAIGDRAGARQRLHTGRVGETLPIVAELNQQARGQEVPGSRE
jgi:hypothetical protein